MTGSRERAWWLRTLLVLQAPLPVFAAFREDTREDFEARQEPVTAIVVLAGIAAILWAPATGRLLDDPAIDGVLVVVLAFLTGALYGFAGYFAAGWLLRRGIGLAGGAESYRRARHLLAYAAVPLALSLALLPIRLAAYGGDVFRSDGSDGGAGGRVFAALQLGLVAWTVGLLVVAVRVVHRWPWPRALAACLPLAALAALAVAATAVP